MKVSQLLIDEGRPYFGSELAIFKVYGFILCFSHAGFLSCLTIS